MGHNRPTGTKEPLPITTLNANGRMVIIDRVYNRASRVIYEDIKMNTKYEVVWGIDVSKDWLDISIARHVVRVNQTEKEITAFIKKNNADT